MIRAGTAADAAFRAEVRGWLEASLAPELRNLTFRPEPAQVMPWYRALAERGWIAPHWPREFGGMGASAVQQVILAEEQARIGAPDIPTQGLNHIGPLLMREGTAEQKALHLPRILNGDAVWCQGYSEPGAGSDLAAVQTRGVPDGDEVVITGHKIWTTWGHNAQWMYALVRTERGASKKQGITFILIDLTTPGILRRPIRTIAGDDEFCEVFFDGVRVPRSNVVGEPGDGWRVATALLAEERIRIGSPLHALRALARLRAVLRERGLAEQAEWRRRLARAEIAAETVTAAFLDVHERFERGRFGQGRGGEGESSYLKILATETTQEILDLAQEAAGPLRAAMVPPEGGEGRVDYSEMFLQSRRLSIYGGSNEIQRSILAGRVLGLQGKA
ncbi:acyl-CoA dehydrogenase family protein [Azospirillum sp.]|uniref:acyl-CoA dehydrogenase family protein n=1 Tax=Azospirillum sp. TaxID=34012 RepID=UPI002D6FA661|nr:acyl-CoA dehydrogenase family protein [Azospirillum sp.]HYD69006.1 acyl-CoA dehydrogenase family protein [Azospirillum sp.]